MPKENLMNLKDIPLEMRRDLREHGNDLSEGGLNLARHLADLLPAERAVRLIAMLDDVLIIADQLNVDTKAIIISALLKREIVRKLIANPEEE
jgi:hypothetical protein